MDEAQRKAHAKEMEAHASKTLAEADEIRLRNGWNRLRLGGIRIVAAVVVFLLGFALGAMVV